MNKVTSKLTSLALLALGSLHLPFPGEIKPKQTSAPHVNSSDVTELLSRSGPSATKIPLPRIQLADFTKLPPQLSEERIEEERSQAVPKFTIPLILVPGDPPREDHFRKIASHFSQGDHNLFCGYFDVNDQQKYEMNFKTALQTYREKHQSAPGFVFAVKFSKPGSLEDRAHEIDQFIKCVQRLTGAPRVQALGECMAGLALRKYVKNGGEGIEPNRLCLLGTPNEGMLGIADAATLLADLKKALKLPIESLGGFPINSETRKILSDAKSNFSIAQWHNNPALHELNTPENLKHEVQTLGSIVVIGHQGYPFLQDRLGMKKGIPIPHLSGDTVVPAISVGSRYAINIFKHATEKKTGHGVSNPHKWLRSDKDILDLLAQLFSGKPLDLKPDGPFRQTPTNRIQGRIHSRPPEAFAFACATLGVVLGSAVCALALMNKFLGWPNGKGWDRERFLGIIKFETRGAKPQL